MVANGHTRRARREGNYSDQQRIGLLEDDADALFRGRDRHEKEIEEIKDLAQSTQAWTMRLVIAIASASVVLAMNMFIQIARSGV